MRDNGLVACMAAVVISLLTMDAEAQNSQFRFDAHGNLLLQTAGVSVAPVILSHPHDQVVAPGALASFFVVAANIRGLSYQWRVNGANLSGATADTLLLTNVSTGNEGQYSVVLVNGSGSVTSAPAALLLDSDRDGLPDSWEQTYFGGLGQKPTGDFDGDGVSNLDEFLQGTNPADSASLLFRLTLVSDGGQVVVSPSRFTFTNGEVVTLTATAIAPNTFHGWRGATNTTTDNSITLTMDDNKTVYAYLGSYDISWANNASGDWNVASNWSPDFVPGTNDNVIISKGVTVTLNSSAACGSLTLSAGTLTGSGSADTATGIFVDGWHHERERADDHSGGRDPQRGQRERSQPDHAHPGERRDGALDGREHQYERRRSSPTARGRWSRIRGAGGLAFSGGTFAPGQRGHSSAKPSTPGRRPSAAASPSTTTTRWRFRPARSCWTAGG